MKISTLRSILNTLPDDADVVTGEEWLPERLIKAEPRNTTLYLEFDNAPDEGAGDEEARGFVEHEVTLIRTRLEQLLKEECDTAIKADAVLALLLMAHENTSSEFIELLSEADIKD